MMLRPSPLLPQRYLGEEHLAAARRAVGAHAFFGLLEAYNTSIFLMARTFGIGLADADFAQERASRQTQRQRAARRNGRFCRVAMRHNRLDAVLYEWAHRRFCERLERVGLHCDAGVQRELGRHRLCSDADLSDAEVVCSVYD